MMKITKKRKSPALAGEKTKTEAVAAAPVKQASAPVQTAAAPAKAASAPAPAAAAPVKAAAPKPTRVLVELVQPQAKRVCVAGSFNQWKESPLAPAGNGRWVGDLAVGPGKYEYLFVVDGQWVPDPNAKESVQNPYGGKNSVMTVSE